MKNFVIAVEIVLCIAVILWSAAMSGGIVNNAGDGSEDSVVVSVINWDSTGCVPIGADSFWVAVLKSGTNDVVFKDSGTATMTGLDTVAIAGRTIYYFHRAVADIDGAGSTGVYDGELVVKNTSLGLFTSARFNFQVVGWELDEMGDSAALAGRLSDSAVIRGGFVDSLMAVLDTLQNHDDWVSGFDPASEEVTLDPGEFAAMADTMFGRDSGLFDEGYWHKIAERSDSGSVSAGTDSSSVARWVWNTPFANHALDGTFGGNLDAKVSGLGNGSGAYAYSLVTYDALLEQVITSVSVAIRNLEQTALVASGATNSSGRVSFNLDAGMYLAVARAPGYLFETNDTIVVSSVATDTVFGTQFDPGVPPGVELCRVYGHLYDLSGIPRPGISVSASLPSGVVRFSGVIVSPAGIADTTDEEGYFFLDLIPSDLLTPSGTLYEFSISRTDGTILRQRAAVPNQTSWCLSW